MKTHVQKRERIASLTYNKIYQEDSTMTSDLWCPCRSMAVRMEDYEVYYRKQKADSNCGFAEEFEVNP